MGSFSIWHWLIVLAVVALVFGTKRLGSMGSDLGSAIRGFKKAMNADDAEEKSKQLRHEAEDADFPGASQSRNAAERDRQA